ncbi:MAG: hypothetical protein PHT33_10830 [bacterium]|nr:hypothetical protein [bacterium]
MDTGSSILIVSDREDVFTEIFTGLGMKVDRVATADFVDADLEDYRILIYLPGYFEWQEYLDLKKRIAGKLKRFRDGGGAFYSEYVQSDDYILRDTFTFKQNHPPRPAGLERVIVRNNEHEITRGMETESILPVRNCVFLPGYTKVSDILLSFAVVQGTDKVLYGLPRPWEIWPALIALRSKTMLTARYDPETASSQEDTQRR